MTTAPWLIHVIDDDEPVRTSLLFALQTVGFQVNGYAEADAFLARGQADRSILISDVRMPGMNGIELTRLLKKRGSTIPIILITGNANRTLHAEAMAAGADALLEKPTALQVLLAEIARVTTERQ